MSSSKLKAYQKSYQLKHKVKLARQHYEYYLRHKSLICKRSAKYRLTHKQKIRRYLKRWMINNIEKARGLARRWRRNNPDRVRIIHQNHYRNNPKSVKNAIKRWRAKTRPLKPNWYIKGLITSRLHAALNGKSKSARTLKLLGCSIEHLKLHLQSQFKPGMQWNNHGLHGWHIDHIVPCSRFDLSKPDQQMACFHYTNLQPLWAAENLKKSDMIVHSDSCA